MRYRNCSILLVTAAVALLSGAGCSGTFEAQAFLLGAVVDSETRAPVGGAVVSLDEHTVSTGTEGQFAFDDLEPGEHRYEVTADTYETGSGKVTLHGGKNELSVALMRLTNARLEGSVSDRTTGGSVAGARVSIGGVTAGTDGQGRYHFADIEPGEYTLQAECEGYQAWHRQMVIPLAVLSMPIRLARAGLVGRIAYCTVVGGKRDILTMSAAGDEIRPVTATGSGNYHPCLSPDGEKVLFAREAGGVRRVWLAPPGGIEALALTPGPSDDYPAWSPDGASLSFQSVRNGTTFIVVYSLDGRELAVLGKGRFPAWSPDGQSVACIAGGRIQVYPAGGGVPRTVGPDVSAYYPNWSPDGRFIAYSKKESDEEYGLYLLDLATDVPVRLAGGRSHLRASFSPDSSMLAYHTTGADAPSTQIYVIPALGGEPLWISRTGGENSDPCWRRDAAGAAGRLNP